MKTQQSCGEIDAVSANLAPVFNSKVSRNRFNADYTRTSSAKNTYGNNPLGGIGSKFSTFLKKNLNFRAVFD